VCQSLVVAPNELWCAELCVVVRHIVARTPHRRAKRDSSGLSGAKQSIVGTAVAGKKGRGSAPTQPRTQGQHKGSTKGRPRPTDRQEVRTMTAEGRVGTYAVRALRVQVAELEAKGNGRAKKEPVWVEQKAPNGATEMVDLNLHPNVMVCECGDTRYVANGDRHQVTHCKPCTKRARKVKRNVRARVRRAGQAAVRAERQKETEAVLS